MRLKYGPAIRAGFAHLLANHKEVFTIGQGLWSPWYVGSSMTDLDKEFGVERVIDTPVSELATTGAALGASLCGARPIVIHPRVDFALLAVDQIVNQAAKWNHMFGGQIGCPLTVRLIINRGGEQGAQHSQSLHSWFAHIPGLRVVMPSTATDARDLLIASVLCDDPVVYIDDRWLYDEEEDLQPVDENRCALTDQGPRLTNTGSDITLVASSYSSLLCRKASSELAKEGITCDVIDLRVIEPLKTDVILKSISKTGRLLAVDGDWSSCGFAGEVIARAVEELPLQTFKSKPARITLVSAPAPTSRALESLYYPSVESVVQKVKQMLT
jgi:pyruvate dehydrogenase E1 component beta subunit